jgi:lysophospholipase L1-like esterase
MRADLRVRDGLRACADLLKRQSGRIAYAGNSVTAQRASYRVPLHERLVNRFGQAHAAVGAGLGATGAMGTLFTLPELVLRHAPQLCFVECSVGDIGTRPPEQSIGPVVEGIVRRLGAAGTAVCLLHLYRDDSAMGDANPVVRAYERVADHYGIPSIDIGATLARAFDRQQMAKTDLLMDGIHTTAAGAGVVADLIAGALDEIFDAPPRAATAMPPPLHADHFEFCSLLRPSPALVRDPGRCHDGRFRLVYPYLAIEADNAVVLRTGADSIVGLLLVTGPHCGDLALAVDGGVTEYRTWDRWCEGELLRTVVFREPVRPQATMTLEVLDRCTRDDRGTPPLDGGRRLLKLAALMKHTRRGGAGDDGEQRA